MLIPPVTHVPDWTATAAPTDTPIAPTFTPFPPQPQLPSTGLGPQTIARYFGPLALTQFAECVWLNEGGYTGYIISPTGDHGGWQLHVNRGWPGDNGLGDVFLADGHTWEQLYDFEITTAWVAAYVAENGFGLWDGADGC